MSRHSPTRRTMFWLRVWWWARRHAVERLREEFPTEYQDARRAWRTDTWQNTPAWSTDALPDSLALHDAAESLGVRVVNE